MVRSWSRVEARWHSIGSPWSASDCPSTVRETLPADGGSLKDCVALRPDPEKSDWIVLTHKELK